LFIPPWIADMLITGRAPEPDDGGGDIEVIANELTVLPELPSANMLLIL
jgi:hypothetical protein